jgi:hypothetical protein
MAVRAAADRRAAHKARPKPIVAHYNILSRDNETELKGVVLTRVLEED